MRKNPKQRRDRETPEDSGPTPEGQRYSDPKRNIHVNAGMSAREKRKACHRTARNVFETRLKGNVLRRCAAIQFSLINPQEILDTVMVQGRIRWDEYVERFIHAPGRNGPEEDEHRLLHAVLLEELIAEEVLTDDLSYPGQLYAVFEKKPQIATTKNLLFRPGSGQPCYVTDIFDAAAFKIALSRAFNASGNRNLFTLMAWKDGRWTEVAYVKKGGTIGLQRS